VEGARLKTEIKLTICGYILYTDFMTHEIRWQQRFSNFKKAYTHLEEAVLISSPDFIQQAGIIQIFEYTFELGWKTLKDYLLQEGLTPKTPRDTLKMAFQSDLISNGTDWLDALDKRNLLAHTYDDDMAAHALELIVKKYKPLLDELHTTLNSKLS